MVPLKYKVDIKDTRGICNVSNTRIFGFIMYTRRHSYVVNALSDTNKWNELDEISGADWPIFSVKPRDYCSPRRPTYYDRGPFYTNMMVMTTDEPNDNRDLLEVFSLNEKEDLPCFVIFIWRDDDELERLVWKLNNDSVDEVFKSIREVVEIISETEGYIYPEYKKSESVYRNVKQNVEARLFRKSIVRKGELLYKIKGFISTLFH